MHGPRLSRRVVGKFRSVREQLNGIDQHGPGSRAGPRRPGWTCKLRLGQLNCRRRVHRAEDYECYASSLLNQKLFRCRRANERAVPRPISISRTVRPSLLAHPSQAYTLSLVASLGDRQFYTDDLVVASFARALGWQSPVEAAEAAVLVRAAAEVRGKRVLDIGVGGGRTVPLLLLMTNQYVGIDYSEPMVTACRQRFPGLRFSVGDARTLEAFSDGSFDFVLFSDNGIDNMNDDERRHVYSSVRRVLSPGGLFAFSTLNMAGAAYGETPFQTHRPGTPVDRSLRAAVNLVLRNARRPGRVPARWRNWKAAQREIVPGNGWAMAPLSSSNFTLVNHFVTLGRLREELQTASFDVLGIYGPNGSELDPGLVSYSETISFYGLVRN